MNESSYAVLVAVLGLGFASILLWQFVRRRRLYHLIWAAALSMGSLAAACFVLFLATERSIPYFRLYYIFGALLMAAYLGLGSIYLLAPRSVANLIGFFVLAISLLGILSLAFTPVNSVAMHSSNVEAGTKAISGFPLVPVIVLNTFGALAVIGGACYSGFRLWFRHGPPRLLFANLLIASGTVLASLAGALARLAGSGSAFWQLLALGFAVLFAGFLLTLNLSQPQTTRPR